MGFSPRRLKPATTTRYQFTRRKYSIASALFIATLFLLTGLPGFSGNLISRNPETKTLWENFKCVCDFPRTSKNEGALAEFIVKKAAKQGFQAERDKTGNVLVKIPATPGREMSPTVILQSHLDMVGVKVSSSSHDFSKDPIKFKVENGWITSGETTLGADNGIGVAIMLTVMDDDAKDGKKENRHAHGPLELLFTVDEEGDFSGVTNVSREWLKGRILLNLDSEEDHEINIGCAGGQANILSFPFIAKPVPADFRIAMVKVSGLRGGHSGVDINRGRANAIVILSRLLNRFSGLGDIRLVKMSGGTVDTAIPNEAEATIAFPENRFPDLLQMIIRTQRQLSQTFSETDPRIKLDFQKLPAKVPESASAIPPKRSKEILGAILSFRNGIHAMSRNFPGQVQTSENIGVIKTENDEICFTVHLQGSSMPVIHELSRETVNLSLKFSGTIVIGEPYSPWEPDLNSRIVQTTEKAHQELFGKEPYKKVVHAGVECGAVRDLFPDMDMISFGPRIENAHSPRERLNIITAEDFRRFLVHLLESIR